MLSFCEEPIARSLQRDVLALSTPPTWTHLAQATAMLVATRITSIEASVQFEVAVVLETSNDGTHWEPVWQNLISVPTTDDLTDFVSATGYMVGGFLRFRAETNGLTTGWCRVEVRAAGRSRGVGHEVEWVDVSPRPAPCPSPPRPPDDLENTSNDPECHPCLDSQQHNVGQPMSAPHLARSHRASFSQIARTAWRFIPGLPGWSALSAGPRRTLGFEGIAEPIGRDLPPGLVERVGDRDLGPTDLLRRTDPLRASFYLPPRLLRPAVELVTMGAVSYPAAPIDYIREVRVNAGPIPAAQVLRVLYVDPVVRLDGSPAPAAATHHVLKSLAVSTSLPSLGTVVGEPIAVLNTSRTDEDSVKFYGFESTQYAEGSSDSRPVMVGVSENVRDGTVDYVLVDHDPRTGEPAVKYIDGVPRGAPPPLPALDYKRVMPGVSYAVDRRIPRLPRRRLLMALAVASEDDATSADLVVGFLSIAAERVTFVQTDRARIPRPAGESNTWVYESLPIAWHEGLQRWIVMATIGDNWEGRFHLVDLDGRIFRLPDGSLKRTLWWHEQRENSHSGNVVSVNQRSGNVVFQTAHNSASGRVSLEQQFTNQWDGIYVSDNPLQPPDAFPVAPTTPADMSRGSRWASATVSSDTDWEFQSSAPSASRDVTMPMVPSWGVGIVVARRRGFSGGNTNTYSRRLWRTTQDRFAADVGTGFHRIVAASPNVTAHVALWIDSGARVRLGVAFTEDARR